MPRRILEGEVVSDKMDKTVTVKVERRFAHPVYKKYVRRTDKYAAHDENNAFKIGDRVQIEECAPISKRKTWRVITPSTAAPAPRKRAAETETGKAEAATPKKEAKTASSKKAPAKKAAAKKETKKATSKKKDESK